jgi:2-oxoglutarate ferredoxin oxidoreductase subunit gamma
MREEFHFRGSGGQGILLMGLVLAYSALEEGLHLSWIPSYGAERRGGPSFCAVTVSDEPVDCPVTDQPTLLFTMDQRAARTYAPSLRPDAVLVYNSTMVSEPPAGRFKSYGVEASRLAAEAKLAQAANMVALGAVLAVKPVVKLTSVAQALPKALGARKSHLAPANFSLLETGFKTVRAVSPAGR